MTTHLVGDKSVGPMGYGLMGFGMRNPPDEQAFACMLTSIKHGSTFWDTGEFYGIPDPHANLNLLNRFFTKYPEHANTIFLSVKGGLELPGRVSNGTPEFVRKSVENCISLLGPHKQMDLFQCARVDSKVPVEETIKALAELVKEGKFKYIGLSEVSAETIRRAHKIHPITAVEIEYSPFSIEAETNGVLSTCKELGIVVIAYSPLGRGFLTGQINKLEDIPANDFRHRLDRFKPENFPHNLKLAEAFKSLAQKKGCTVSQLALAWILAQHSHVIPIPGSCIQERTEENLQSVNVKLTSDDLKEIRDILDNFTPKGGRYFPGHEGLWA